MATGDENFVAGFMDDYYAECDEHLSTIRRLLLTLEESIGRHPEQPVLEELFRSFHSIKGISGMVELREAEMLAHHMESLLRALRQHGVVVEAAAADALVRGVNVLERTIAARRTGQPAPASAEAIALIEAAIQEATPSHGHAAAAPSGGEQPSWRLTFVPSPALVDRGVNVDSVRARLRAVGTIVDAVPKVLPTGIAFEFLFAGDLDAATLETFRADGIAVDPTRPGSGLVLGRGQRSARGRSTDPGRTVPRLLPSRPDTSFGSSCPASTS